MAEGTAPSCPGCVALQKQVDVLRRQVEDLTRRLEEALRRGQRQAGPFSKGPPRPDPKPPGRKPGEAYGQQHHRAVPAPAQVREVYAVPLPAACGHCQSPRLTATHVVAQYQVELPSEPIHRRFDVQRGRCQDCGRAVAGRHALQTSSAVGAAASQLGPRLQAFLTLLQKRLGLSYGKCKQLLFEAFGLAVSRSGVVKVIQRLARRVAPALVPIRQVLRHGRSAEADETSWKVAGKLEWLHVLASDRAVLYQIAPTRSAEVAARVLGADYAGVVVHDGYASYNRFRQATHQTCLFHVLRRCRDLLEHAGAAAAAFPRAVKELLQRALALRDAWRQGVPRGHDPAAEAAWQRQQLRTLVCRPRANADNRRLAQWLRRHLHQVFTFLEHGTAATSSGAERALRPAVVNRKVWGGNRTRQGAWAQSTLMSVLQTLAWQHRHLLNYLSDTLRSGYQPVFASLPR